ncbi:hypothetical protein [Maritimibacter sp. UBA3975]|uniref:hypothetical protein n=1 Tax=Maritimibacter sp. UBA3975 TaxID=1946833 RepID=UPI000C0AA597|nr:hypothetical protein [Maritimibacter sp. UBA3975]MAM60865.1 hypothetical protein [Maritimibacter sp.]|tara:strand:+ start:15430 stop:15861 length:432 start_codon:yes stop_codon:yes gene_type:complete
MELTNLETKSGENKGAFLHLSHPAGGFKMWTGEGSDKDGRLIDKAKAEKVGVHVLGLESERVRERARQLSKKKLEGDDDAEEAGLDFVCSLVTEFVGLTQDGKPLVANEANKRAFFEQSDALVKQVMDFAGDKANFWQGDSAA